MMAVNDERDGMLSQLPDRVKAQIWSILSHTSTEGRCRLLGGCRRFSSGSVENSIGNSLRRQGGLSIRDSYLPEGCKAARRDAEVILQHSNVPAGMGGRNDVQVNRNYRGDRMCWLKPTDLSPAIQAASEQVLSLQTDLAMWGFDVGGRPSIQLSMYPGEGARYERHTDASDSVPNRSVTVILYLNPDWDAAKNGGQLCIYNMAERWRPGLKLDAHSSPGYAAGEPAAVIHLYALTVWFTKAKPSAVPAALPDPDQARGRIFVSIAAFRDPETRWTVHDLLARASHPARLRIGIVWQVDATADAGFLDIPQSVNREQIRQIMIPASEATGPCKARMLAQQLWAGEEYFLQIDSHMRFVPGWDKHLVKWLAACERHAQFGKAVLSTYPPSYEGSGMRASVPADDRPVLLRASHFGADGMLRLLGSRLAQPAAAPVPSLFWAAGFSFSRSQLIQEVPYKDLPFLFFGEEQYMLARMFTHGYDMFSPPRSVAYHLYSRTYRDTFQTSVLQDAAAKESSRKQVLMVFENVNNGTSDRGPGQSESLGSLRSVSDLQAVCGVHYSKQVLTKTAKRGSFDDRVNFAVDEQFSR